jgi:hypothetical protein
MKTILWKELREHARWVPLGVIAIVIVLVLKWQSNELIFDASNYGSSLSLGSLIGLVAGGVAACLGVLQSWPDQRPAARALLLHRGITADAAFCGKLLAGLLLYAAAVFVPLLGMAAFIASIGIENRAASPGALLPSALMSIVAFSCWPAALITVQRDAWFMGSRFLPGLTVGLAVVGCGTLMNEVLWLTNTITIATLVGFIAAARSVFVNSSHVATGTGRAGTAVAVTVALLALMMCLVSMIEMYRITHPQSSEQGVYHRYVVELGPNGEPWLTRSVYSQFSYTYEVDQVAKMVPGRSVRDQLQPVEDQWKPLQKWSPYQLANYRTRLGQRFVSLHQASVPHNSSYLYRTWVFDANRDVVLVYRLGAFGRYQLEGKLLPPASVGSFGRVRNLGGHDEAGDFTLVSSTGVYRVPGDGSDVETIYALPKGSRFLGSEILSQKDPQADPFGVMVRLGERVILLERDIDEDAAAAAKSLGAFRGLDELFLTEVRLPNELATAQGISIARDPAGDGSYVGITHDWTHTEEQVSWLRFDTAGQIKEQEQHHDNPSSVVISDGKEAAVLIPPAVFVVGAVIIAIENSDSNGLQQGWEQAKANPADTALVVMLCSLNPIIAIPLAIWAARRRWLDKRTKWRWMFWAFFFGPSGSLAILAVYPRIAFETCSNCQTPTRIDLARCENCDHSLDDTPKRGIEIFDARRPVTSDAAQAASMS